MSKTRNKKAVRFALVPSPGCTCEACLRHAAKGFVFKREFDPHGGKNKACKCRFMPGIEGETKIEGYDRKEYLGQYKDMLEGHELAETYEMQERNGKLTKRLYKTAAYDYKAAGFGGGRGTKTTRYTASGDGLSLTTFEDVKRYIYAAESASDLEHRHSVLGKIYGFDSEQMKSDAVKNAFRHKEKRLYDKSDGSWLIANSITKTGKSVVLTRRNPSETEIRRASMKTVNEHTYNFVRNRIERNGGVVIRGGEEANRHLDSVGADASSFGDVVMFRDNPTVSEVLEEECHFFQQKRGDYGYECAEKMILLREIDAQKYLLSMTKRYNIPKSEVGVTKANLLDYERQLELYEGGFYESR